MSKKIIRGAKVGGIIFVDPHSEPAVETPEKLNAQADLKTLLDMQHMSEEDEKKWDAVWKAGIKEGYRRGLVEGQKQGYDTGKEEGIETGFRKGTEKARAELQNLIQMLNALAMGLSCKQEGIYEQMKPELIQFCFSICENLLRDSLKNPKAFIGLIERLITEAKTLFKEAPITIVLSPEDLEKFQQDLNKIVKDNEDLKKLTFASDKGIEQGNCRIETSLGLINFDIKRLLADLGKKVLEVHLNQELSK